MPHYRRANTAGATYFFTVVTYRRQTILCDDWVRQALRDAVISVRAKRPFTIDAWVLLPDHVHCLWTLPPGDADFPMRWGMIKRQVSVACGSLYKRPEWINPSKRKHRESTFWQRRYWEHQIRDDRTSGGMLTISITTRSNTDYANVRWSGRIRRSTAMWRKAFIRLIGEVLRPDRRLEPLASDLPAWARTACPPYLFSACGHVSGRAQQRQETWR